MPGAVTGATVPGANEEPAVSVKAQEAGELLGQALTNCRQVMSTGRTRRHGVSLFTAWRRGYSLHSLDHIT